MTADALLAGLATVLAVFAAWDALEAVESSRALGWLGTLVAPLVRAGREGRAPTVPERRRLGLLAAGVLAAGGWLVLGPLAGILLAAGGPWSAVAALRIHRRRYQAGIARGAPALARALADALAGGHSVHGALLAAAEGGGVPGPAGAELRRAAAGLALGEDVGTVLDRLRGRAAARPIDAIVAAIDLQRRAGGDLARLLRDVADALDEALRVMQEARSATAQARFTGFVVCGLGASAAGLAELADPGYLAGLLTTPIANVLLVGAIVLQAIAFLAIRRLGRVPVA